MWDAQYGIHIVNLEHGYLLGFLKQSTPAWPLAEAQHTNWADVLKAWVAGGCLFQLWMVSPCSAF